MAEGNIIQGNLSFSPSKLTGMLGVEAGGKALVRTICPGTVSFHVCLFHDLCGHPSGAEPLCDL